MTQEKLLIQEGVRFSDSKLWEAQRHYYDTAGIEKWSEQVPFYVTSNPFIADFYARIMLRMFQDWTIQHPEARGQKFYIIELGAGTGQFSFYVLKRMRELQARWGLNDVSFCYVMTDFTASNIDFWQSHACLQSFVDDGSLDFATYDFEQGTFIKLLRSNVTLSAGSVTTPISVIANYLFDSIVVDFFNIKNAGIQESLVDIKIPGQYVKGDNVQWPKVELGFCDKDMAENYYQHAVFDQILHNYRRSLQDTYLQFPIGGLRGLENLSNIANGQLMLLSSDKGHVSLDELDNQDKPSLDFHGSFSLMANYHAIGEYFRLSGGEVCLQELFDAFATGVFSLGFKFEQLNNTRIELEDTIGGFCPGHYYHQYDHFDKTVNTASIEFIASMLKYTHWDPAIFDLASDRISELLEGADEDVVGYITRNLSKIADNFYFLPGADDTLFDLAVYCQELEDYELAVQYYRQSEQLFPHTYELFFNLGFCYMEMSDFVNAQEAFHKAREFQPKSKELQRYIKDVERKLKRQ